MAQLNNPNSKVFRNTKAYWVQITEELAIELFQQSLVDIYEYTENSQRLIESMNQISTSDQSNKILAIYLGEVI